MNKMLSIITLDTNHARTQTLLLAAENLGYVARVCSIDNSAIVAQISESDGVASLIVESSVHTDD